MKKRRVFRKKPLYSIIILIVAFLQYVSAQSSNDDIICNACKNGERVIQLASEKEKVIKQGNEPLKMRKLRFAICDKDKSGKYKEATIKASNIGGWSSNKFFLPIELTSNIDATIYLIEKELPTFLQNDSLAHDVIVETEPIEMFRSYPLNKDYFERNPISPICIGYKNCLYIRGIKQNNDSTRNVDLSLITIFGNSYYSANDFFYSKKNVNIIPGTRTIRSLGIKGLPPNVLTIPSSVNSIEDTTFSCIAFDEIKVEWFEPEKVKVKRYYYNCSNTRLIVPIGYKSKYERCYPWNTYDIVEQENYCDDLKAIKDIFADKKTRMKTSKIKDSSQVYTRKQRKSHKK